MSATPLDVRAKPIVAIDGPAGSGKGTTAKAVAKVLGVPPLDTGSIYRAITWACLEAGISLTDEEACAEIARTAHLGFNGGTVARVNSVRVKIAIRDPRVTTNVSAVSAHAAVRNALISLQRDFVKVGGGVVEGRDIGSVVLPNALLKVYLTADVEARAMRRIQQVGGDLATLNQAIADLERRDTLDSSRMVSPLMIADDAVVVDNTHIGSKETTDRIVGLVRERLESRVRS